MIHNILSSFPTLFVLFHTHTKKKKINQKYLKGKGKLCMAALIDKVASYTNGISHHC